MSSRKENEGHLIQRVNRYVSALGKCTVVNYLIGEEFSFIVLARSAVTATVEGEASSIAQSVTREKCHGVWQGEQAGWWESFDDSAVGVLGRDGADAGAS